MGAAKENRDRKHMREVFDRETAQRQRESDLTHWLNRLTDERDAARVLADTQATELAALRAKVAELEATELAALRAKVAELEAQNATLTEERDEAIARAERAPAHYKHLWQVERQGYHEACRRYQQLKTIALCGISRDDWDMAKADAQTYYPHVDWSGVDRLEYPRPPLWGYRTPEAERLVASLNA